MSLEKKARIKYKDGSFLLEVKKTVIESGEIYSPTLMKGKLVQASGPYKREVLISVSKEELIWPIIPKGSKSREFYFVKGDGRRGWLGYLGVSYLRVPSKKKESGRKVK